MNRFSETARTLLQQEPGLESRQENATGWFQVSQCNHQRHRPQGSCETADGWPFVIAVLSPGWRVIVCRDELQWILQRRKKGSAERPWRSVGYFRTRQALARLCATLCGPISPKEATALAALPEIIGQESAQ